MPKFINAVSKKTVMDLLPGQRLVGKYASLQSRNNDVEDDLLRDCWFTYYLSYPYLSDPPPQGRELNAALIDWVMQGESFRHSRFKTMGRIYLSGRSAELLAEQLLNDPEVKEAMKKQKEANELMSQLGNDGDDEELRERIRQLLKEALEKFTNYTDTPEARSMRSIASQKIDKHNEEANGIMRAWGLEDGPGGEVDASALRNLMSKLNESFLQLLVEAMGRAHGIAMNVRKTEKKKQEIVVTDAGYTRRVLDVFPFQRAVLLDDSMSAELHLLALAEYGDHGLIGTVRSSESVHTGTIFFLIDGSGSMSGLPHLLSKAICLGLGRAAESNGQTWMGSVFGGGPDEFSTPVGTDSDPLDVLHFATHMFGGGTDFDSSIKQAFDYVMRAEDPEEADIIMLTDMQAGLRPSTKELVLKSKREHGIRLSIIATHASTQVNPALKEIAHYIGLANSIDDLGKIAQGLSEALWDQDDITTTGENK